MTLQLLLMLLLLITAVLPPLLKGSSGGRLPIGRILMITAASGCAVVAIIARDRSLTIEQMPSMRPVEVTEGDYRGSDSCRVCHPTQHRSWHDSYHRSMTQLATPETVIGEFGGAAGTVLNRDGHSSFHIYEKDQGHHVSLQDDLGQVVSLPIVMTTGSHHMQIYWFSLGRENSRSLGMLPFVYLIQEERWIPRHAAFLMPQERGRELIVGRWNATCVRCHSTDPRAHAENPDRTQADTMAAEFGISCEACHGPGDPHVVANSNPLSRYMNRLSGGNDQTIINPARLDHQRGSQVCGLCHSVSSIKHESDFARWHEQGYQFQPGQQLTNERHLVQATKPDAEMTQKLVDRYPHFLEDSFWSDGMLRVTGREYTGLLETPCHQQGKLSCMSCHQMHKPADGQPLEDWRDDQLKPGMRGNQACISCHTELQDTADLAKHTHHLAESQGSNCYNCHMPHTSYGLLKAVRSHQVDSPDVAVTLETGRPVACNQCHLDKPLGWTADRLTEWYGQPRPELSEDQQEVAASILWLLSGDAGQRALTAWTYSWPPALEVSGDDWQAPMLTWLFDDPYQAVAFIAGRSLHSLPGYDQIGYDFLGNEEHVHAKRDEVRALWQQRPSQRPRTTVLIDETGQLLLKEIERLYSQRDNRRISLTE